MSHGHCHGEHHDHDTDSELGIQYSLFEKIDTQNLQCLNETVEGSGKTVFKPWELRLDREQFVESDCDEELIFNIPFTGSIKLKGIKIVGEDSDSHPSKLRLFKNRPGMSFDDTAAEPDQSFELYRDCDAQIEYATKVTIFSSVTHLTMHVPSNFGAESTKIFYIGLRGEWAPAHRHGVTICTYEATPNVDDHKLKHLNSVSRTIS